MVARSFFESVLFSVLYFNPIPFPNGNLTAGPDTHSQRLVAVLAVSGFLDSGYLADQGSQVHDVLSLDCFAFKIVKDAAGSSAGSKGFLLHPAHP